MNCERILNSWSIRKKLLLLLLIIFLPASAIIVASGLQQRENEIAKARNNASILVESLAAQQVQVATSTNVLLTTIAQMPAVRHSDAEACNILFRQLQKDFPLYSVILAAATPDGNMFAASKPFKPGSVRLADRKHFKDAIETLNFSVGEYMTGRVSTLQSLNYTLPVLDDHKKPLAIIIAGFGLDEYAQFVSRAHMPAGYSVTIADWRGVRLFRSPETAQTAPGRLISPDVAKAITANLEHGFIERINTEDQDTLYAFRRLRLNDNSPPYMYMLVGVSRAEILHAADLHMLGNLAILGVVAVIAMFLAWWFGDTVLRRPISQLVDAAQQLGTGKLHVRTGLHHSSGELGQLARSFDDMAVLLEERVCERQAAEEALNTANAELETRVQERTAELSSSNAALMVEINERKRAEKQLLAAAERLKAILDNAPVGIVINDREGHLIESNSAHRRMCGYSAEELKGTKFTDYTHPDDIARNLQLYEQLGSDKLQSYEIEKRYIRKDGKIIWIRVIVSKINAETNIGIVEDITARKQAEEHLRATADRLQAILDNAPVGIVITDHKGRLIEYNAAHLRMCGYSAEELKGTSFMDYTHPDDIAKNLQLFELVASGQRQSVEIEKRYLRKDGSTIWVRVISSSLNKDFNIGIVEDITARKQAKEQLCATADRLKAILEHAPVGIVIGNRQSRFVESNAAFQRMVGYSADELQGMDWKAFTHPDDITLNTDLVDQLMQGKLKNYDFEKRYVLKDGRIIWVRVIGSRLDEEHKISIIEDITERKQAAEQLRRSEARLRRLIDSNIVGVVIAGPDGAILDTNKAFLDLVGYAREDFRNGLAWRDLTPSEHRVLDDTAVTQAGKTGVFRPYEKELLRKNGTRVPVIVGGAVTEDKEAIVFALDLTELKSAQLELEQLARIVESADDAIISVSSAGTILSWNQGAGRLLGYTKNEMIGASEEKLLPAENSREWEQIREVMAGGKALDYFKTVRIAKSGEEKPVWLRISSIRDGNGKIIGISKIARDRSEAIQAQALEEKLRQAQKLESLGRLAGGVAHDFNNLLMVIQSYTEMLQDSLADDSPLRRNTQEIIKAANRAASLTRQMLAFSRKQILSPVVLDLNAVINETAKMLKRLIGEDIEFRVGLAESLWAIEADSDQIVQILMNLCVNARDAMPRGGTLAIATGNVTAEQGSVSGQPYIPPGDYVRLLVTDTGMGMSKDVQGHIFDPFFTTKEVGKGTGLGLATVYGIVKQSGGYVWVDSELGQGTCFTIYLPRVKRAIVSDMLAKGEARPRGGETLLVAEDEGALREATCDYLRSLGYTVFAASSGQQALSLAGQYEGHINLLITDLVMPGISGRELAQTLESLRPDLKTIYMSGYSSDAVLRHGIQEQGATFLQKPFSLGTLARKVRDALGRTETVQ